MNPINNQVTLDEITAIANSTGVPQELLIALWDRETGKGAGLKGKQNHFGPWELTASTYKSYVTREAKSKFSDFPEDINAATKDQILAVSAEKLKRDWESSGKDVGGFLRKWQGNHPTIGIQNVEGVEVKQADYSTPIVDYNMRLIRERGPEVKLARSFSDLPQEEKAKALAFYKGEKPPEAAPPEAKPQQTTPDKILDFVMQALSKKPEPSTQEPITPTQQAYQNLVAQYNALSNRYVDMMSAPVKSVWDAFNKAAFKNYDAPHVENALTVMQRQITNLGELARTEALLKDKAKTEELRLARQANEIQKAGIDLERANLALTIKNVELEAAKVKAAAAAAAAAPAADSPPKANEELLNLYKSSVDSLEKAQAAYLANKDNIATPQGLKARDAYQQALKRHIDIYSQVLKQKTPTNADLANLAELQLQAGLNDSDEAALLPSDVVERVTSHIRSKGGSIENAIDESLGKNTPESIQLKNILRGKPNAVGQNAKQALNILEPAALTSHVIVGFNAEALKKKFAQADSKKPDIAMLLAGKRTEAEQAAAEQVASKQIVDAVVSEFSKIQPYGLGPLALRRKIGDTIADLQLDPQLYPQLAKMDVEERQLIPTAVKLIKNKIINIDDAAGQIAQFYSDLAKRKDKLARVDKLHVTLPKGWTVAVGKNAFDLTKPSQVNILLRDELVKAQMLEQNSVLPELPMFFGP